ncbi:hypothetical protein [Helicobacter trogontum]
MLKKSKYKIITRGFRYDMLKRVFNEINYVILDTTPPPHKHKEINTMK